MKHNETDIFRYADQTGRYRLDWGELVFNASWNPLVYAYATPGPFAASGFKDWFDNTEYFAIFNAVPVAE